MYEEAVIKEFEMSMIKVSTLIYEKFTVKTAITPTLVFVVVFGLFYMGLVTPAQPADVAIVVGIICIAASIIGLTTALMASITGWGYNHIPSYQVGLVGRKKSSWFDHEISQTEPIIIPITILEKDQVAICKAAQSLEPIAQEFDEKARVIKKIAEKCKELPK